jgi:peptidoglycan/LPS O-acetylase OafA/YrhL
MVAAASPLIGNLEWSGAPEIVEKYLAPGVSHGRGRFPMFPNAAYVAFGIAAGSIVRALEVGRLDRFMQWAMLSGFVLMFSGYYFSNLPYSMYTKSDFWTDSPTLITIRCGIALLLMAGAYLWTEYAATAGWSWMQTLGKNSLMVYWVHVMLVYGDLIRGLKQALSVPLTAFATVVVTALMVGLSAVWLRWKAMRAERWRMGTSPAGKDAEPARV